MSFEIEIQDPREIRNVSEAVLEEVDELSLGEEKYFGLVHNHYSIVRGRNEESRNLDELVDSLQEYIQIFREDGGKSWIHSPESRCYEKVQKINPERSKSHEELMAEWGNQVKREMEDYLEEGDIGQDINPEYDSGDIYDANTGKQIGGLSMEIHGDKALSRLCFYEDNHEEDLHEAFHQLIDADMEAAETELDDPRENYMPLPGFYQHLMPEVTSEIEITGKLSSGTEVYNPRTADYCISRQPS